MIEVYPDGTLVEFIHGEGITGKITGVMIERDSDVSYRVAFWDSRTRKNEWVRADEVKATVAERITIGFAQFTGNQASENAAKAMREAACLREGPVCKGGQNEPNLSSERPPTPGGSGAKPESPEIVVLREGDIVAPNKK